MRECMRPLRQTTNHAYIGSTHLVSLDAQQPNTRLVTDAFVFSFWYLDQLGMSSKYGTKSYCRQTLVGGNYGLLNTTTFEPNPDYYKWTSHA